MNCEMHLKTFATKNGRVKDAFPGTPLEALAETCALDVADEGEHPLHEIATLLNLTRERVRQIEQLALLRMAAEMPLELRGIQSDLRPSFGKMRFHPRKLERDDVHQQLDQTHAKRHCIECQHADYSETTQVRGATGACRQRNGWTGGPLRITREAKACQSWQPLEKAQ